EPGGNPELDCVGLAHHATTLDRGEDCECFVDVGDTERLFGRGALLFGDEVFVELLAVDGELAGPRAQEDAGDCALATAGSVILNQVCHFQIPLVLRGAKPLQNFVPRQLPAKNWKLKACLYAACSCFLCSS